MIKPDKKIHCMGKRPMCWLCLLLMAGIWLGDLTGVMPIKSISSSQPAQQAAIYGQIYQYYYSENSVGICLKNVYLESQTNLYSHQTEKKTKPWGQTMVYMQEESDTSLPLGTWIRVKGKLQAIEGPRNPGEFDSRLYYQTRKIDYRMSGQELTVCKRQTWYLRESLRQIREALVHSLKRAAPKQAGMFCAMTTGEKSLLKQEEKNLLAVGSLSHIISISGMHLSLLGMLCFHLLQRLRMGILSASVCSVMLMLFYGMLTGESVSAMRALGMFALAMAAKAVGRSYDLLSALALSAIFLLLDNPAYLYYSGFLLSCGCICAVGVLLPQMQAILSLKKLGQALLTGFALQAATLPLVAWFYCEIPLYGIWINLLVIPTLAIVLVSGVLGAAVGIWQVSAAKIVLFPGCILIQGYQFLCELARKLPGAVWIVGQPKKWQILLYYGLLAAGCLLGKTAAKKALKSEKKETQEKEKIPRRLVGIAVFLIFWCAGTLLMCHRFRMCMEITCLDVGQGDSAVVCTPQGECYLIDGGSSSQKKVGQYRILPFLRSQGVSQIDVVFVSHTDADHINGIEELLQMIQTGQTSLRIDCLVLPRLSGKDEGQQRLAALAKQDGTAVRYMKAGEQITADGVRWRALSPLENNQSDDINENSLVLLLESGSFRGLFTGDIGEEQEERLFGHLMDCDFLKVAHHGSRYSTGERFLKEVRPKFAVASASATNMYGHPHPDTLKRLKENNCYVFLTKDSGAVTLKAGDETVKVETYLSD